MKKTMSMSHPVTEQWIQNNYNNIQGNRYYEDIYLLNYPEFTVQKLRIQNDRILLLLNNLPIKEVRTREDVFKWMKDSELTVSDFGYVGW